MQMENRAERDMHENRLRDLVQFQMRKEILTLLKKERERKGGKEWEIKRERNGESTQCAWGETDSSSTHRDSVYHFFISISALKVIPCSQRCMDKSD